MKTSPCGEVPGGTLFNLTIKSWTRTLIYASWQMFLTVLP